MLSIISTTCFINLSLLLHRRYRVLLLGHVLNNHPQPCVMVKWVAFLLPISEITLSDLRYFEGVRGFSQFLQSFVLILSEIGRGSHTSPFVQV
jgi:hypothetical protein